MKSIVAKLGEAMTISCIDGSDTTKVCLMTTFLYYGYTCTTYILSPKALGSHFDMFERDPI